MNNMLSSSGTQTLKINSHDPRSHQNFLQFSNDMHRWQTHINDSSWWLEREKLCLELFQQYGYELQSGVWYCLIACQRSGWKGIASTSLLLANGFARQQTPCWPPLAALDLRRQILDNYCRQLLPLIYTLPTTTVNTAALTQLLTAAGLLEKHAAILQSTRQTAFRQLSTWLENCINTIEQQAIMPTLPPAPLVLPIIPPPLTPEPVISKRWPERILWSVSGGAVTLLVMILIQKAEDPDVLRLSNRIWPENPWVEQWQQKMEKASLTLSTNSSTQQLSQQLDTLEQRLLDAEQKRKPYMTISELKTSVYQMHNTLRQQTSMVENRLHQLQIQLDKHQPVSSATISSISAQINELNSMLVYLSGENQPD